MRVSGKLERQQLEPQRLLRRISSLNVSWGEQGHSFYMVAVTERPVNLTRLVSFFSGVLGHATYEKLV